MDGVTWQEYGDGLEAGWPIFTAECIAEHTGHSPREECTYRKPTGRNVHLGIRHLEDKTSPTGRGDHPQPDLRGRLSGLFVWVSAGAQPAPGAGCAECGDRPEEKVNWILDADIRGFFDNLDKDWLVQFVEHRVADPRILRLIQKWLNAGVMEEGEWSNTKTGSPQGSVISPLLANIYLHYAFDLWVNVWRKKWAHGEVAVIRYADDVILGFQHQTDADRFLENLKERVGMFGLELHPDKTRRIEFGRFAEQNRERRGEGKPETFDFLGFKHISGKNRLGRFTVRRKTIRKRMRAKLREIKQQLRERMHDPVRQTGQWLKSIVQGHFNYYAVPGNIGSLSVFRDRLTGHWWQTLRRRSQKRRLSWIRMLALADRWLPRPRVLHPYPADRFAATHPR